MKRHVAAASIVRLRPAATVAPVNVVPFERDWLYDADPPLGYSPAN
jgi:hypothetical protein